MRATEFITELFQPGKDVNFKWSRPFKDEVNVLGKTPQGHELSVNFWEISDDIVAIDFTIDANSDQDPDPDTPTKSGHELTKHGEEFAVFTQVVNAITQYLNKLPKNNVFFQVKRTEAQREPLYLKIANRVAKQLGFRHGTAQELEATNPGLYNKFDNRYSKLLWYTKEQQGVAENTAAGINKMFNNLGDPVYANLQRVALLAMQGRQQEAHGRLNSVIKDASPQVQKKIIDAVNVIKPVTINGKVADSSTLDKSKAHQDWILNTFIPWVQSLLGQQGVAEGRENVEHFNGLDFSIEIEKDDEYVDDDDTDNQTIYVKAFANGRELGHVLFTIDYDGQGMILKPQDLEVDERFQGQGIAATMYDYVKSKGYRIRRSGQQTDAGAGFWGKHRPEQNVWEDAGTKINFTVQKSGNKFATTMTVNGEPAGVYQYNADTGRSVAEVYPEYRGKGLGKVLVLHAIYTAAQLGLNFQEDESRTSEYDNVLDSLSNNGYIVDDDGYWYVTGEGEQYLQQSMKQGVAENFADGKVKGRSRPGRVKRSGASCKGSVSELRARAKKYGGERGRMYHWCANMKGGRSK